MQKETLCIRKLPFIQMKAEIIPYAETSKKEFENYFRTWKKVEEYVEDNHFYSPFFSCGDVLQMHEHFGDRVNAMGEILPALKKKVITEVNLRYDFRFVSGNKPYHTDGDFFSMKWMLSDALEGTGLYIAFLVSHFGQLTGNPLTEKAEHYHLLLCQEKKMDDAEYDLALNRFAEHLQCDWIDVRIKD